ncbi:hypothetical protein ACO0LM_12025 [Undibacterium sp. Di26W]|uniref:hypothetical protein n=1 Tax=Undibacterium sp. Di26W TaxID=3413035 RepID=UPI003BF03856
MLESTVEKNHCKRVKNMGGRSLKFKSPQYSNVPDRIDLIGADSAARQLNEELYALGVSQLNWHECREMAKRIVAAAIQFTELKQPGKKPNAAQEREHVRLREQGFHVNVVDGVE